jgi:LGFP repeat
MRLIGGGKQGRYYVLDASSLALTQDITSPDMAKIGQGFQAFVNNDRSVAADQASNFEIYGAAEGFGPNIHGGPCFWPGPNYIYQMPEKDYLKAFYYDQLAGLVHEMPALTALVRPGPGMPGGHSSLSANGERDGIVWTCVPTNDGQWVPTPGSLHAFDGLTLKEIWADLQPEWFAKFNPPTIADGKVFRPVFPQFVLPNPDDGRGLTPIRPGKVIVYGLLAGGGARGLPPGVRHWRRWPGGQDPLPLFTIDEKWAMHGGSGALAEPQGREVALHDKRRGRKRDYAGSISSRRGRVSVRVTLDADASCHRPLRDSIPVSASVFWSRTTGAYAVLGDIREEYLRQGAHASALGYPVSDERDTADGHGRISHFEGGDIVWYPQSGAETRLHTD